MADIISRPFIFTTPVSVNGVFLGNILLKGTASTYADDTDLIFPTYTLTDAIWNDKNQADLIKWMGCGKVDGLIDHVIKEHLRWLFSDLQKPTPIERLAGQDHTDLTQDIAA